MSQEERVARSIAELQLHSVLSPVPTPTLDRLVGARNEGDKANRKVAGKKSTSLGITLKPRTNFGFSGGPK